MGNPIHRWPVRVYYSDTDAGGVVYHANYLNFFEHARTEMLRQAGFEQDALMAEGIVFVVRHMDIDFLRPARFNQALTVASEIQELAGASITFRQLLQDDRGQGFCQAQVKVGCLNAKTFRPVRIPLAIKQELARVG